MSGRRRAVACIVVTLASTLAAVACGDSAPDTVAPDGGPLNPVEASTTDSGAEANSDSGLDAHSDGDSDAGHSGTHAWSKRFGVDAQSTLQGAGLKVDLQGNVVVAGSVTGDFDFGGGVLSGSPADIFVAKFDTSGKHLWSKRFGDAAAQGAGGKAVALDAAGNIYFGGGFEGTVSFGGAVLTSAGGFDAYVVKLSPTGQHIWSKRFGDATFQTVKALTALGSDVVVLGETVGTTDFGGGPITATNFLVRLGGASGSHVWSSHPSSGYFNEEALAHDAAGNLFAVGALSSSSLDWGKGPLDSAGGEDAVVLRFDSAGATSWSKRFGDDKFQDVRAVEVDTAGNAYLTGRLHGVADFGTGPVTFPGGTAGTVYVAKLDPAGGALWSKAFPMVCNPNCAAYGAAITVDPFGNVAIGGTASRPVDFGAGSVPATVAETNGFIAMLSSAGAHLWSKGFAVGAGGNTSVTGLSFDGQGNVYSSLVLAGTTLDLGGGPLVAAGSDLVVAKFGP